jgi:hypothetical protein
MVRLFNQGFDGGRKKALRDVFKEDSTGTLAAFNAVENPSAKPAMASTYISAVFAAFTLASMRVPEGNAAVTAILWRCIQQSQGSTDEEKREAFKGVLRAALREEQADNPAAEMKAELTPEQEAMINLVSAPREDGDGSRSSHEATLAWRIPQVPGQDTGAGDPLLGPSGGAPGQHRW